MLHQLIFVIFSLKWLCIKFFQNIVISFVANSMYFAVFLKKFISVYVIQDLNFSFIVQVPLPYSGVVLLM
jgi:hypothetical protein